MKNVTAVLSEEHQNILRVIDTMLDECQKIRNGKKLEILFFEKAIDFIKNYADKYHHAKEEDILFLAMLENSEVMHCNPIPVMLSEHDSGRNYVKKMEKGLNENNPQLVVEGAIQYGQLLQQHIYKEDNVLYPMAEEALSEEQKERVLNKYDVVENNVFSADHVQRYISLFNEQTFG